MMFWDTRWWHGVILRHEVMEFRDPDYWDGMFSHECSCGVWWLA